MKLGFGGGCHWCTEGVFRQVDFVKDLKQGWISSIEEASFSEAITLAFDGSQEKLERLIYIHLNTHSCTSQHSMRTKYRSAVYVFDATEMQRIEQVLTGFQPAFDKPIITKVLLFKEFKLNAEEYQNYYLKNPEAPFCQRYIQPKIDWLKGSNVSLKN